MADRPTVTVDIDGAEHEVELPDGFIPEDQVREQYVPKDTVETIVQDRVGRAVKGRYKKDELLDDEEFLKNVAQQKADELRDMLDVKGPNDPDVESLRRELAEAQEAAKEASQQNESLSSEVSQLRERSLAADIQEAMSAAQIVDESDVRDLVPLWVEQRMEYDPEHGRHVVVDSDGNVRYAKDEETGQTVPMGAKHLLIEENKAGRHKGWFKDPGRSGAGFNGSRGGSGPVTLKQFEAMSSTERSQLYRQNPDLYSRLMTEKRRKAEDGLRNPAMSGQ